MPTMQAVVKTRHIEITVKGNYLPPKILSVLKKEYGNKLHITEDKEEELVNVFETDWYRNIKKTITPGFNLKLYRGMKKLTQEELGKLLGNIPKQHISNMEKGIRPIILNTGKSLPRILVCRWKGLCEMKNIFEANIVYSIKSFIKKFIPSFLILLLSATSHKPKETFKDFAF
ncbi:MAG: helix-turn-helix transcriptional regulator [Leptospiraceae bacterium]|nr:helix-turn-helix transcriptional regulator [Leptospiraceae bacterium]